MNIINYDNLKNKNITFKYSNITNKTNIKCFLNNQNENQNIFIKTPKSELHSNIDSGFLVISFYNTDKNNIFTNFIKKIEKEANLYIKNILKKKSIKLHSNFIYDLKNNDKNYKDKENITKYIFKLSKYSKQYNIFDYQNNIINKIDIYSNIILLIKLQNIWLDLDSKTFGLNWNIFQIKVYPEINLNQCIIFDSDDDDDYEVIKKEIIVQKCIFCNSQCIFNNTNHNISIAKGGKGAIKGGKGTIKGGKSTILKSDSLQKKISNSGRGSINIENNKNTQNTQNNKNTILPPTPDELITIRNKLKKMVKINSDSD